MTEIGIAPDDQLLSVLQAARWLKARGVSPHSPAALHLKIARGALPARTIGPRMTAVRIADLEAFAKQQKRTTGKRA